jgi:hypothetical protein
MKKITITDDSNLTTNDSPVDDMVAKELAEAEQDRMLEDDEPQLLFSDNEPV